MAEGTSSPRVALTLWFRPIADRTPPMSPPCSIYIVGPSSTGKTTLCRALAERLHLPADRLITEVARDVMRRTAFSRADVGRVAFQRAILDAQVTREREARPGPVLSDRCAVDPVVYATWTGKDEEEARERREAMVCAPGFSEAVGEYRRGLVVLLGPVPEWLVDDGVRSMEDQVGCHRVFCQVLDGLGIRYRQIGAEFRGLQERIDMVLRWANEV